jgi:hypothetical protein
MPIFVINNNISAFFINKIENFHINGLYIAKFPQCHEPNLGCDRHQNCSFVSKIGQNGPKINTSSVHSSP